MINQRVEDSGDNVPVAQPATQDLDVVGAQAVAEGEQGLLCLQRADDLIRLAREQAVCGWIMAPGAGAGMDG